MAGTTKFVKGWRTGGQDAQLDVSFAWGSAPFATTCASPADRDWFSASTSVRSVFVRRGREHDLDTFTPGTARIVLDNRSRLYDPSCTTNALAGKVLPGTPVRIRAKQAGSAAVEAIYMGFVESYELQYPEMKDATVTVQCADGMKFLRLASMTTRTTGARTGTMIGKILTAAGWPSSSGGWSTGATTGWRSIALGKSSMQNYRGYRQNALTMCRNLADSEAGVFLVDQFGKAMFRDRSWYKNQYKTTDAIFSDRGLSSQIGYQHIEMAMDDAQLWNHVTINRIRGAAVSTWSTASIDKYGRRVLVKNNLLLPNATKTRDVAYWMVQRYKDPECRAQRVEVQLRSSTQAWHLLDNTSGVTIGSMVRVARRPPGGGVWSTRAHVEGIDHTVDVGRDDWILGVNVTPANLFPSSSL